MSFPSPTSGIGVAARVIITSSAPTLVLQGSSQLLDYQITAEVTDVNHTPLDPQPTILYSVVTGQDIADIDDTGLVVAGTPGWCVIQCAVGNLLSGFIYAEQNLLVTEGVPITPSFSFTLSTDSVTISTTGTSSPITITQTVTEVGGIDPGPVTYSFYGTEGVWNWADGGPSPAIWFSFNNNVEGSTTTTS